MATRDQVIATEIQTDPLNRGYLGALDDDVRDDINTAYRPFDQGVFLSDLYQFLIEQTFNPPQSQANDGSWPVLELMRELSESRTIQGQDKNVANNPLGVNDEVAARHMLSYLQKATDSDNNIIVLDMSKQVNIQSWDLMVADGCISQNTRDAIDDLSDTTQTRGSELGVGSVTTADITRNRV